MTLTPVHDPAKGVMLAAAFMSGSGSNVEELIKYERNPENIFMDPGYKIAVIVTDCLPEENSKAKIIGKKYGIDVIENPKSEFLHRHGVTKFGKDKALREAYDRRTLDLLLQEGYGNVEVAAFGGYMTLASKLLVDRLLCINVHPADLRIKGADGLPKYRGDDAVTDAINAGERELRSTTHICVEKADMGPILMVSAPIPVVPEVSPKEHQSHLKEVGDWKIFPLTLAYIARGTYTRDQAGTVHFYGRPKPDGVTYESFEL